jgi:hypothetical protein
MPAPACPACGAQPALETARYCAICGSPLGAELIDLATPAEPTRRGDRWAGWSWRNVGVGAAVTVAAAALAGVLLVPGGDAGRAQPEPSPTVERTAAPTPDPAEVPTEAPSPTTRPTPTPSPTPGPLNDNSLALLRQHGVRAAYLAFTSGGQLGWLDLATGERLISDRDRPFATSYRDNLYPYPGGVLLLGEGGVETAAPGREPIRLDDSVNGYVLTSANDRYAALQLPLEGTSEVTVLDLVGGVPLAEPLELPATIYLQGVLDDGRLLLGSSGGESFAVQGTDLAGALRISDRRVLGVLGVDVVTEGCAGLESCGIWVEPPPGVGEPQLVLPDIAGAGPVAVTPAGDAALLTAYTYDGGLYVERRFVLRPEAEPVEVLAGVALDGPPVWDPGGEVLAWRAGNQASFYNLTTGETLRLAVNATPIAALALVAAST